MISYMNNHHTTQDMFCNNCGKQGHLFYICKMPITSIGVIAFRIIKDKIEYLMIRRKDTLGYVDFMRGKFDLQQKQYIMNMITQMTVMEKDILLQKYEQIKRGESVSLKEKIIELINGVYTENEFYDLKSLILESKLYADWKEPEWGFPKGRRNTQENDYNCAVREFAEETGYPVGVLNNIRNIVPMEEIFTGSNYNSYRHKYYIMNISYEDSKKVHKYQKSEVSGMEWMDLSQCLEKIRPYNLEKKNVICNVDYCVRNTFIFSVSKI